MQPDFKELINSYSSITGTLAGLAFAGLVVYVAIAGPAEQRGAKLAERRYVVQSLIYTMAALVVCSFLFANFSYAIPGSDTLGKPDIDVANLHMKWLMVALLIGGVATGIATLSLFHSASLMLLHMRSDPDSTPESKSDESIWSAGRAAGRVLVGAGPVLVLALMIPAATMALYEDKPKHNSAIFEHYRWPWFALAILVVISTFDVERKRARNVIRRLSSLKPHSPSVLAFYVSVLTLIFIQAFLRPQSSPFCYEGKAYCMPDPGPLAYNSIIVYGFVIVFVFVAMCRISVDKLLPQSGSGS